MKVYQYKTETNELVGEFDNVISWGYNFVEFENNGCRGKIYCGEDEYFSDKEIIEEE